MRFRLFLATVILTLASSFAFPCFGSAGEADVSLKTDPKTSTPLPSLVEQYLTVSDLDAAERVLTKILQYPDATVQSVSSLLQQPRSYLQRPTGKQPSQEVTVRDRQYPFSLYVPSSYDPAKAYPLIVCLHGAGFTGATYLDRWVPRLNNQYILVCPTISMGTWWSRTAEEIVLATIDALKETYHVDQDRVFLTGMSNGGIGAWIIGMHYADLFAGIAPMASGVDDVLFPFVENLRTTPVYIIHGLHDQVMPVSLSRTLVNEMVNHGIQHVYQEHNFTHPHAGGHFFPREELPALVSWFDKQKRSTIPQHLSVVRDATHLGSFSWVRIDATDQIAAFSENLIDSRDHFITGKVYAKLDAIVQSPNRIVVRTERVRRYTLFLNDELVDFSQPVTIETNGKMSYKNHVTSSLEVLLRNARRRRDVHRVFPVRVTVDVQGEVEG